MRSQWISSDVPWKFQLFSAARPLEFVAIDISGPLQRTTNWNQHVFIIPDRFSRLTEASFTAIINTTQIAKPFSNIWVMPYWIHRYKSTKIGLQFVNKLFATLCYFFEIKKCTTTPYQPQTSGHGEYYNRTIVARLRYYVSERHRELDTCLRPVTYAYDTPTYRKTGASQSNIVPPRELPSAITFGRLTISASDMMKDVWSRYEHQSVTAAVRRRMEAKQKTYQNAYDKIVRREQQVRADDDLYIDHGQHAAFTSNWAEECFREASYKRMGCMAGLYNVPEVQWHAVAINEDGILNRITIDSMTPEIKFAKDAK